MPQAGRQAGKVAWPAGVSMGGAGFTPGNPPTLFSARQGQFFVPSPATVRSQGEALPDQRRFPGDPNPRRAHVRCVL